MKKIIFKSVDRCDKCPYFRYVDQDEVGWYECGFTDKTLINVTDLIKYKEHDDYLWNIPKFCPLEDYELFHKSIDIVKGN